MLETIRPPLKATEQWNHLSRRLTLNAAIHHYNKWWFVPSATPSIKHLAIGLHQIKRNVNTLCSNMVRTCQQEYRSRLPLAQKPLSSQQTLQQWKSRTISCHRFITPMCYCMICAKKSDCPRKIIPHVLEKTKSHRRTLDSIQTKTHWKDTFVHLQQLTIPWPNQPNRPAIPQPWKDNLHTPLQAIPTFRPWE